VKPIVVFCFLLSAHMAWAVQRAKVVSPDVEIYAGADYDSDVIDVVHENEAYYISDKTVGPFYKIKLKSGKIGYISDYELDIEGKGRMKEQDLDELFLQEEKKRAQDAYRTEEVDPEEEAVFGRPLRGPTLQLINFHEDTLGGDQMDNVLALGFKSVSQVAWSVLGSYGAPKYYEDKTGGTAKGGQIWADLGFSANVVSMPGSDVRFGGSFFTHLSVFQVDTPAQKYDLQELTLGVALETAWMIKVHRNAIDLSLKYYFDKSSYAALGLSYLF
jgi:hypothetical protein